MRVESQSPITNIATCPRDAFPRGVDGTTSVVAGRCDAVVYGTLDEVVVWCHCRIGVRTDNYGRD